MRFKNSIQDIETDKNKFSIRDKVKLILHFMEKKKLTAVTVSELMKKEYTPSKIHTALVSNPNGNPTAVNEIYDAVVGKDTVVTITQTIEFTTTKPL